MPRACRDFLLLLLGAALYTAAAPPFDFSLAGWFALTPVFLVASERSAPTAFVAGLIYGFLFCIGIAYWVYFAVVAFFPFGVPLSLFSTALAYLFFIASYCGLATAGAALLWHRAPALLRAIGIPALWVSAEFARSSLFSGFSWELLGYTQYRHLPLIQIADLTGVYGLSFLMAMCGYVTAEALRPVMASRFSGLPSHFPWRASLSLVGLLIVTVAYGSFRIRQYASAEGSPLTVALIEHTVPPNQRWNRAHSVQVLGEYLALTQQTLAGQAPDLIVWPEFAVDFYLAHEPEIRKQIGSVLGEIHAPLLLGAPRLDRTRETMRYYNSAYLVAPSGDILADYDKQQLLPFAEYRPFGLSALLPHSAESPSEFSPGVRATVFPFPPAPFGAVICYEVTYPTLTRQLTRAGAQFLVNISNDAWLTAAGKAAGAQHFSMAVLRAVENRRPLVRLAASGESGFIAASGQIQQRTAFAEDVLLGQVVPHTEQTVYTHYGDWFATCCVGLAGVSLGSLGWRSRSTRS